MLKELGKHTEQGVIQRRKNKMAKGKPRRDGSGCGTRANRGRGGCSSTRSTGRGRNKKR